MKKIFLFLVILFISNVNKIFCQNSNNHKNDFKIGIYSPEFLININNCCDTNYQPYTEPYKLLNGLNCPTSQLNVLSEDGFNIAVNYAPNIYSSRPLFIRKLLELYKNNNMQLIPCMNYFYKPDTIFNQGLYPYYAYPDIVENDTNIYDFSPYPDTSNCTARPNYDRLIREVFSDPNLKDVIWGYYMTEEASYQHPFNSTDLFYKKWDCDSFYTYTEVPPQNVSKAIGHFKHLRDSLALNNHKLIVCEANHGRAIFDSVIEISTIDPINNLGCQPWMYIHPSIMGNNMPDVFFDGSYLPFRSFWYEQKYINNFINNEEKTHYLGNFKTIDWAYTHVNEVHDLIEIAADWYYVEKNPVDTSLVDTLLTWKSVFHSDTSIRNANWLWFQTYTSIIHGSKGIWFWQLPSAWQQGEPHSIYSNDRFIREKFPQVYKEYVSPLARQLAFLVRKNILSTDTSTIIATKKDNLDLFNVVKPYKVNSSQYPQNITGLTLDKFLDEHTYSDGTNRYVNDNYNLRYTIRSNGDETAMIVTNPLACAITTSLDFRGVAKDDIIRNAKKYSILFEEDFPSFETVTAPTYKTMRGCADIENLILPDTLQYVDDFDTAINNISFGHVDSHIINFGPIDNQWFDELKDKTELSYNNIRLNSEIKASLDGNIFFVRGDGIICASYKNNNGENQIDWLNGYAPKVLNTTGFAINEGQSKRLYYVSSEHSKLFCLAYINNSWQYYQVDNHNVNVRNDSRVIYSNGKIYCVRQDGTITATDEINGSTIILNSNAIKVKYDIGITINSEGNKIFYQGTNGYIYQIDLLNNQVIALYGTNISIRPKTRLHYSGCNSLIFVRQNYNDLNALWQDENLQWHVDWLAGGNAKVKEGTDVSVFYHNWSFEVYYLGIDNFLYKICNDSIIKISPTNLVKGRDNVCVYYSNGKIHYGGSDTKLHTLYYRNNYYDKLDLYIQDTPTDLGSEPNTNSDYFYISEDIWVRNQDDGIDNQESENAIYNPNGHSYVYVKVRNKSSVPSSGTEYLKLYWSKAGTSLSWPNAWNGSSLSGIIMGNIIDSLLIPTINPNSEAILKFIWELPNPDEYSTFGENWHFCLLARIESSIDTMYYKETSNINNNVKNNNNIALKNISIITNGESASISIINPLLRRTNFIIKFNNTEIVYPPLTKQAEVLVKLNDRLFKEYLENISRAKNIGVYNYAPNTLVLTGDDAYMEVAFNPEEINMITMQCKFLTQEIGDKSKFKFNISLFDSKDNIIGGELFIINKPNRPKFKADAGEDKIILKGNSTLLNASSIGEIATYNWIETNTDSIIVGQSAEVSPLETKSYTLSVMSEDGFIDYDNVSVIVKEWYIENIIPNPANNIVSVKYEAETATMAMIEIVNSVGLVVNSYTLNPSLKEYSFNVSQLPQGTYTIILNCDNMRKDAKTLIVN